jgi:hypothetical protein
MVRIPQETAEQYGLPRVALNAPTHGSRQEPGICWYPTEGSVEPKQGGTADGRFALDCKEQSGLFIFATQIPQ